MASTIIIKNGDGTSVPSSLKQGEFAINVDNGFLYYGTSGSSNEVSSGWQFGAVTSSGNVSASGDIAGNSLTINAEGVSKASISDAGIITGTGFTIGNAAIVEAELETIDGVTAGTVAANKAVVVDSNKDIGSFRNITLTGELDAGSLDVSGDVDIDGTLEADAITIDGVTLSETIADTVGAMVTSNTESGITVAYDDSDNTLDFTVGTLNQNTTGTAATVTTAAQTNITSLGTLTALTVDNVAINGSTIGHTDDTDLLTVADGILTVAGEVSMTTLDIGGTNVTSTAAELNILDGVTSTAAELNILDGVTATAAEINALDGITAVVGELNALDIGSTAVGTAVASKAVILDSNKDYTGIRNFTITGNLSVGGTTTQVDTVTMNAQNAVVFEGATADNNETILTIVDPTADHTYKLPDLGSTNDEGYIAAFAADPGTSPLITATPTEVNLLDGVTSTTAELNILDGVTSTAAELNILDGVTSTAAELNILDGVTSTAAELNALDGITAVVGELNALDLGSTAVGTAIASKAVILDSNKDYTGIRNLTVSGELDAATGDFSGAVDIAGDLTLSAGGDGALTFSGQSSIKIPDNAASALVIEEANTAYMTFVTTNGSEIVNIDAPVDIKGGIRLNGTGLLSTAEELNILDGVTSTTAELNILDGVTSTASELNALDGITAVVGELNALDIGSTAVGTAVASKAVILDENKDYTGIRNLTVSGELDAATGDFSGDVDIAGDLTLSAGGDGALVFGPGGDNSIKIPDNQASALVIEEANTAYMTFTTSNGNESINAASPFATSGLLNIRGGWQISSTTITSTAAELNILDGVTSTAAELNILDGVTSTAAELNILDGVTSTTAELNILDGVTSTTAELNYVDGVTSAIQTQINTKSPIASPTFTGTPAAPTPAASTDSTQIATTAYVKDQYSYQYISFFGAVSSGNNSSGGPYYIFTSGNGISNHSWTKSDIGGTALAITADTIDLADDNNCSQLDVSTYNGANQIVVPQTSEIVGFYATNRSGVNGPYHVGNALFVIPESGVNWGDSTGMTAFLKYRSISSAHSGTDENFSNSNINTTKVMMCKDMARGTYEVAAGSIIVPAMFCDTHSQAFASSMTIVTRTKIQS